MKKRIVLSILSLVLILSFVGCTKDADKEKESKVNEPSTKQIVKWEGETVEYEVVCGSVLTEKKLASIAKRLQDRLSLIYDINYEVTYRMDGSKGYVAFPEGVITEEQYETIFTPYLVEFMKKGTLTTDTVVFSNDEEGWCEYIYIDKVTVNMNKPMEYDANLLLTKEYEKVFNVKGVNTKDWCDYVVIDGEVVDTSFYIGVLDERLPEDFPVQRAYRTLEFVENFPTYEEAYRMSVLFSTAFRVKEFKKVE